jgi:hypothetical protein
MSREYNRVSSGTIGARQVDQYRRGVHEARREVRELDIKRQIAAGLPKLQGRTRAAEQVQSVANKLTGAKANLQSQMQSGTLTTTGPSRIAIWLYGHVAPRPKSLDDYAKESRVDTTKCTHLQFAEFMRAYQSNIVSPVINTAAIQKKYGFPSTYVRICSDASWIK